MSKNREEYLEHLVREQKEQIRGLQETLLCNQMLMAAMVKEAGGALAVKREDVKAAVDNRLALECQWDAESKEYQFRVR